MLLIPFEKIKRASDHEHQYYKLEKQNQICKKNYTFKSENTELPLKILFYLWLWPSTQKVLSMWERRAFNNNYFLTKFWRQLSTIEPFFFESGKRGRKSGKPTFRRLLFVLFVLVSFQLLLLHFCVCFVFHDMNWRVHQSQ